MRKKLILNLVISIQFAVLAHATAVDNHYHPAGEILIKGHGGWDALSIDPESHRLFVSHADRVVVIDTVKNQVIKEITDTLGVHCIAIAPDLKKAFSTNGKEAKVSVIDLSELTSKTKIKVGEKPDAIVYEPTHHEVYAFNGNSNSVSIINAKTDRVVATVELPGKPEFAVVDSINNSDRPGILLPLTMLVIS